MNRILQFIHDNQLVICAAILFLAVLTYCLFNRYDAKMGNSQAFGFDRLRGRYLRPDGTPVKYTAKQ